MTVGGVSWRARVIALAAVVALVATVAVVVAVRPAPDRPAEHVPPGLAPVLGFAADSADPDPERRSAAIRRWVLPARSLEFSAAYDDYGRQLAEQWGEVTVTPVGYQIVRSGGEEARVVLLSEVRRTAREGSETTTVWELSGYGVIRRSDRWWVYSYVGTQQVDDADDPLVRDLVPVPG